MTSTLQPSCPQSKASNPSHHLYYSHQTHSPIHSINVAIVFSKPQPMHSPIISTLKYEKAKTIKLLIPYLLMYF